jgi:WD40 repeat protein
MVLMWKRAVYLTVGIALTLWAAACQAAEQVPEPTGAAAPGIMETAAITAADTPTGLPSETPAPSPSPISTAAQASAPENPLCFPAAEGAVPFAFMPDNLRILSWTGSGVQIFNLETLEEERFLEAPANLLAAALSPDGQTLAWSLEDNTIQLVSAAYGKLLNTLEGHSGPVYKLRYSPTGDRLYSASHDTWVRIWNQDGEPAGAFQPTGADDLPSEVVGVGVSPDGKQLATIPFDGPVKVWNLADLSEAAVLGGTGGMDTSDVAFSPDGQFVAADLAGGLSLWRVSDAVLLKSGINSLAFAFSPDGRYLAYADIGENNRVFLSSPDGAENVLTLDGQQTLVWELIFSPDSSLLAAVGGETQIWQVEDGRLLYVGKAACP